MSIIEEKLVIRNAKKIELCIKLAKEQFTPMKKMIKVLSTKHDPHPK